MHIIDAPLLVGFELISLLLSIVSLHQILGSAIFLSFFSLSLYLLLSLFFKTQFAIFLVGFNLSEIYGTDACTADSFEYSNYVILKFSFE